MSAGEIQLAALGMQDAHLTGSPQISYLKGVYRRHTPFGVQSFQIPFENKNISWGGQGICRIPYKGDMIQSLTLAVTLPPLFPSSTQSKWPVPAQVQSPQPYLWIDDKGPYSTFIGVTTFFTVETITNPPWIPSPLSQYISYSPSENKFVLTGASSVSINVADVATSAVFWGLDPNAFSSTRTINGQSVKTWKSFSLTTIQAGWVPYAPSATLNATNSILFQGGATLTNAKNGITFEASCLKFSSFGAVVASSTYINVSPMGSLTFKYPGTYAVLIEPSGIGQPTKVGIGHTSSDGHPLGTWTYDYSYTYTVQFSDQNPRVLLPIKVTDTSQYYFLDFQGASGQTLGATSEVSAMDINEFWTVGTTGGPISRSNVNLTQGWTRSSFTQQVLRTTSETFSFFSAGLYNIYGTLTTDSANTITSVGLWQNDFGTKLVTQWNTTQAASPSVNFSLPVQVLSTSNSYSLRIGTNGSNLYQTSMIGLEYFGYVSTSISPQENDFRQNGLLAQTQKLTNYPLGQANVNLYSTTTNYGLSEHIHITPGGNLTFSNSANYRITSYFETSNAYVSNVSIWTGTSDTGPWTQGYSRSLPLGISGGYAIDLVVDASTNFSSTFFQIQMGLTGSLAGQITTDVTSNAYFTFLGVSSNAPTVNYGYVDSVGTYLIESAELKIGGQSVQTLTGEVIEIYNDLFVPQENQPGLTLLTGKLDTSWVYTLPGSIGRTYYINLPFFFYGNHELSLPICSLGLHDLEVYINFNNFQTLLNTLGQIPTPESVQTSMIVDYAYLSTPEIDWFSSHRQDYIIRQYQYDTFSLGSSLTFDINFKGPVRELYFVIQDASATPYVYSTDPGIGLTVTLNGEDYLDGSTLENHFLRYMAPLTSYARQPDRILHLVPLCRRPQDPRPSGSINMSRIYQKKFELSLPTLSSLNTKTLRVIAVSYNVLRVENGLAGIMYQ